MRPALWIKKEGKGRTLNAARGFLHPTTRVPILGFFPPTQTPRLPAVPEAGSAAARADLLHAQGEAQEAAQGGGNPEDLAALQSTGVKESERLKGGPAATARPGPTQPHTHPFHDPAVHLNSLPLHYGSP